jgi:hypothetical protein
MGWLRLLPLFVALLSLVQVGTAEETCSNSANSDACEWAAISNKKKYSFNLATPTKAFPHGILSEDGFYKVTAKTSEGETNYWFQLCEHMKFNFNPPLCENCEACGGAGHCGETCSAIMSSSYPGYSVCTTLGFPGSIQYSFIDQNKPEQGVRVNMTSCNKKPESDCSFSVLVQCSHSVVEAPTTVTNKTGGGCDYEAILKHPAGCPVVTNVSNGGWGWFGSLLFLLVLAFVVYMAVGIAYRVTVLGVSGFEAIPNLDTWRALPSKIQLFFEYIISQCMGLYYRFTENSYSRVNT